MAVAAPGRAAGAEVNRLAACRRRRGCCECTQPVDWTAMSPGRKTCAYCVSSRQRRGTAAGAPQESRCLMNDPS